MYGIVAKKKHSADTSKKVSDDAATLLPYQMTITEGQITEEASTVFCISTQVSLNWVEIGVQVHYACSNKSHSSDIGWILTAPDTYIRCL